MFRKIVSNKLIILQILFLVLFLVLIRAFENELFYDPFLDFFKKDFANLSLPAVKFFPLITGLFFRYSLNTFFSLCIIYVVFKEISLLKFAAALYCFLFLLFICIFIYIVFFAVGNYNWILFYIRRFLIQPLFLLLFVAGFYYQKQR